YNFEVTNYAKQVPSSYTVPTTPTNGLPATYNQSGLYETAVSTGFQSYSKSGQPNSGTLGQTPIPINYTPIIATGTRTQNTYTPPRDMSMAQGALSTNAKDTNTYIPLPSNTQAKEQESMFGQPPSYENMTEGAPNMFDNPNMTQSADDEKKHKEEEKDKDKKDQNTTPAETLETQQPVEIINK
ncbi:MAG: hypothetical protein NTV07_03825, partial [Candidatus Omnitrophica bacterium]|nr:hypothetical protein [Candidatus Omnitrophota bacterium]